MTCLAVLLHFSLDYATRKKVDVLIIYTKECAVGPKTERYIADVREHLITTTVEEDGPVVECAAGSKVFDIDGRAFIDFTSQMGVVNLGHNFTDAVMAAKLQLERLMFTIAADYQFQTSICIDHYLPLELQVSHVALAKALKRVVPIDARYAKVLFEVSGATAVNAALKLCLVSRPERKKFLAFRGAFHGRHGYTLDVSYSKRVHKEHFPEGLEVDRINFPLKNRLTDKQLPKKHNEMQRMIDGLRLDSYNAFIFEPVQGEGGIHIPCPEKLHWLIEELRRNDVLIVADEIQTGFGRTGKMFACEHFNIQPDIIVLSKAIANGLPLGAVVADMRKIKNPPRGAHSGTMLASPVSCAAALAVLHYFTHPLNAGLMTKVAEKGERLGAGLLACFDERFMADVRGMGLMHGVEFWSREVRDQIVERSKTIDPNLGLLLAPAGRDGEYVIRFMPPLTTSDEELAQGIAIYQKSVRAVCTINRT